MSHKWEVELGDFVLTEDGRVLDATGSEYSPRWVVEDHRLGSSVPGRCELWWHLFCEMTRLSPALDSQRVTEAWLEWLQPYEAEIGRAMRQAMNLVFSGLCVVAVYQASTGDWKIQCVQAECEGAA